MTDRNGTGTVDLAAAFAARPRTVRIRSSDITPNALTPGELMTIGRTLGATPADLDRLYQARTSGDSWDGIELALAVAWVLLRRTEPDLTWAEARTYGLEVVPETENPTRPRSRRPGTAGRSGSTA